MTWPRGRIRDGQGRQHVRERVLQGWATLWTRDLCRPELAAILLLILSVSRVSADRFLLATFENNEQRLRILGSSDASSFHGYPQGPVYAPPAGNNLRDPSIIAHRGRYYVCHTTGIFGATNCFSVLVSDDLRRWTNLTDVPMTGIGAQRTWAPEWFRDSDGSMHILVSASTNSVDMSDNHVIYAVSALDETLATWSEPVRVTGSAFSWTGNEGRRVGAYDPCVIKRGSTYFMFYFNQYTDHIELASAPSLTGPYARVGIGNWQGIGPYKEGPSVVYMGVGRWRMFFADQIYSFLSYTDSTDNWKTWSPPQKISLPGGATNSTVNHGTVIVPPGGLELECGMAARGAEELELGFNATAGDAFLLQGSTDLEEWTDEATIDAGPERLILRTLPRGAGGSKFWRVQRLLPD